MSDGFHPLEMFECENFMCKLYYSHLLKCGNRNENIT